MLMTGLGSGIDYEAMISAIISAERAPKDNQLNRQEGMNTAEMDALKEIQSTLNSFRDKVEDLNSSRELQKLKAVLSNEDVLAASVDSNAVAGEYSFEVTQMAQAQRDQLFKVTEGTTFTSGSISFGSVNIDIAALNTQLIDEQNTKKDDHQAQVYKDVAEKHNIDMTVPGWETDAHKALTDSTDSRFDQARFDSYTNQQQSYTDKVTRLTNDGVTVEELQTAINNDPANDGVKATLVRSGDGISMVLNGKDTGVANAIGAITVSGMSLKGNTLDQGLPENGQKSLQAAQDAIVKYGSMELTSTTNKMENVIDGITLNLKATGTVNVKVERDEASVNSTIKEFVDTYNKVIETVNTYTKSSEEEAAALSGDSATRSLVSRLRAVIGDEYTTSTFSTLSELGITTTRKGTLEIDQKKLDKALEDNFDEVSKLFLGDGATKGVMDSMLTVLDDYHKNGGAFDRRIDQLEYNNKRIADDREQLDARMEAKTITLRDYYAKMDSKIANMNQTQSMLIGMLA